jgi:hypothetical protein
MKLAEVFLGFVSSLLLASILAFFVCLTGSLGFLFQAYRNQRMREATVVAIADIVSPIAAATCMAGILLLATERMRGQNSRNRLMLGYSAIVCGLVAFVAGSVIVTD